VLTFENPPSFNELVARVRAVMNTECDLCLHDRYDMGGNRPIYMMLPLGSEDDTGKEEFVDRSTRVHQSTERIYNYPTPTKKKTYKCQITQYSCMRNFITHTLVGVTVVSTSGRTWMS
jgi:hypothetical protein